MTAPQPPAQVTINAGRDVYYAGRDMYVVPDGQRPAAVRELDLDPVTRPELFCGRRREIAEIGARLRPWSRTRVVVLDGLAGSGKTTLMGEAAYRYRRRFKGVLKVDLGGSTDEPMTPIALLRHLAGRLGIAAEDLGEDALLRQYRKELDARRLLILLDDAAGAEQIRRVATFGGHSVVLATSRVELPGLPAAARIGVESFAASEALDLLRAEVGAARVDDAPQAAASIVRRCGYLPLAIHLVGGRLSGASRSLVSLTELDADLAAAGLDAIAARDATAVASARTMREIFDGVHRRLDPPLQQLFRLLGGAPRSFDATTASALAEVPVREATELLRNLHAYRLVEPAGGTETYRLHDLLREFAEDLAAQHPAETAAGARRLTALRLTEVEAAVAGLHTGAPFGPARAVGVTGAQAARQARAAGDDGTCWRIVSRLAELDEIVGFTDDWPALHALGLAAAEAAGGDEAATAMAVAGAAFHAYRWEWAAAIALLTGAPDLDARASAMLGRAYAGDGDTPAALAWAASSLRLAEAAGDPLGRCRALWHLGAAHRQAGELTEAAERLREAVDAAGAHPLERSRALTESARTSAANHRPTEALAALAAAAAIDVAAGDRTHLARVHADRADLWRRRRSGRRRALADLGLALDTMTGSESYLFRRPAGGDAADILLAIAEGYLALGRTEEAALAADHAESVRVEQLEPRQLAVAGELAAAQGRLDHAVRILDPVADADPRAALVLGDVYARLGDFAAAGRLHRYAGAVADDSELAARAAAGNAEAVAAERGSARARLRIGRRIRTRWPAWPARLVAIALCFGTLGIAAHDTEDLRVGPADGVRGLVLCALAVLLAARLRSYAAGALLGYLSAFPVATGLILLTSDQVRARGDTWSLAAYGVAAAAIGVAVLVARWRVPWLAVLVAGIIALGVAAAAPDLHKAPVPASWWTWIGIALLVAGAGWLPLAALSLPGTYRRVQIPALIAAPIAGAVLAILLGAGLGRQTTLLWPGSTGTDWRLALLGAATAAGCAVAGLLGPARFSAGVLSGLAWFWGINGLLLGSAHAGNDGPNFWLHPIAYWHWLTHSSPWGWLLPLLSLAATGALALASGVLDEAGPSHRPTLRAIPDRPEPAGLRERLGTARWARGRRIAARVLVVVAAIYVGSYLDARTGPPAQRVDGWATVVLVLLVLVAAALLHPDLAVWVRARAAFRMGAPRWLAAAGVLAIAAGIAVANVRGAEAHGWSRGPVAGLLLAAAGVFLAACVAPYRPAAPRLSRYGDGAFYAGIGLGAAAALADSDSTSDVVRLVVGGAVGGGGTWLFVYLRERRKR